MRAKIVNKDLILKIAVDLLYEEREQKEFHSKYLEDTLCTMEENSIEYDLPTNRKKNDFLSKEIEKSDRIEKFLSNLLKNKIILLEERNSKSDQINITKVVRTLATKFIKKEAEFKNKKMMESDLYEEYEFEKRIQYDFDLDRESYLLQVKEALNYFYYYEI